MRLQGESWDAHAATAITMALRKNLGSVARLTLPTRNELWQMVIDWQWTTHVTMKPPSPEIEELILNAINPTEETPVPPESKEEAFYSTDTNS